MTRDASRAEIQHTDNFLDWNYSMCESAVYFEYDTMCECVSTPASSQVPSYCACMSTETIVAGSRLVEKR